MTVTMIASLIIVFVLAVIAAPFLKLAVEQVLWYRALKQIEVAGGSVSYDRFDEDVSVSLRKLSLGRAYGRIVRRVSACTHLDITGAVVDRAFLIEVSRSRHLEVINAACSTIDDDMVDSFLDLKHLLRLDLSSTRISKIGVMTLSAHPSLRQLVVNSSVIPEELSDQRVGASICLKVIASDQNDAIEQGQFTEKPA